jgi:hypothetical protein
MRLFCFALDGSKSMKNASSFCLKRLEMILKIFKWEIWFTVMLIEAFKESADSIVPELNNSTMQGS